MSLALIVLFPLLGVLINGFLGARFQKPIAGYIASAAVLASFLVALLSVLQLPSQNYVIHQTVYTWIEAGDFKADVAFLLDRLSAVMILVVTGIGFLIHLFSTAYMKDDHNDPKGHLYGRYFVFLNLFIAFMSVLVLADNYLLLFVGWEGVGLCSYFLIGFWFQRDDAKFASQKAFVLNRVGDFGFLLAMLLLFYFTGTLQFEPIFELARTNPEAFQTAGLGLAGGLTAITLLLTLGATGKSAQIPLYTWLPDAMAGPTPVSALIHAATMVTAGVYLVARSAPLFEATPVTKWVICGLGAATALIAGLTALAHTDIKKVLAYSTVSQLGFMFMAAGVGAYGAAIFHVFTHAFFKAGLFLGAGSVIHALHGEQDMRKMGGLAKKLSATHLTFLICGWALAGAVPFAGFFSKDEIIAALFGAASNPIYLVAGIVGLVAAFITALYTGRQYGQIFGGEPRDKELYDHAHEAPALMTIPLWILAAGAIFAGFLNLPSFVPGMQLFSGWLEPIFAHGAEHGVHAAANPILLLIGAIIGWGGWLIGRSLGINSARAQAPGTTSLDKFYGVVVGETGAMVAVFSRWIDEKVIDGVVNGVGGIVGGVGAAFRSTQTSFVRNYALAMALGAAVLIAYFIAR